MKKHPVQTLLEIKGVRTFAYSCRDRNIKCLGAYCTLGGLLQVVSYAHSCLGERDLDLFISDISGAATNSGRIFYWQNVKWTENISAESITCD